MGYRLVMIATGLISTFVIGACTNAKYKEPAELKQAIDRSVPVGSSKAAVAAFLNTEGIESSYKLNEAPDKEIQAIVRDVSGVIIKGSLTVKFQFDESGRLTRYDVEEVLTGP